MRKIKITDRTIVQKAQKKEISLSFKEKIEIARLLENAGVDVIEFPAVENERIDTLLLKTVCAFLKNSILSVNAGTTTESVELTYNAVSDAEHPRLYVELPVSPVQMEYIYHKKGPKMLEMMEELITKASSLCPDTEFIALDATRAERDFLYNVISTAIKSGAKTITLCDSEGHMLPNTFVDFLNDIKIHVPEISDVSIGVMCSDAGSFSTATSLMSVVNGAGEIKCTSGSFNLASIMTISDIIRNSGDNLGIYASLNYTKFARLILQVYKIVDGKSTTPDTLTGDIPYAEFNLTENDDFNTVTAAVARLGYDLSEDDNAKVYEAFKELVVKKPVSNKELDAIVATNALQVPPTYKLISYVINSGNIISASAHIVLEKDGEKKSAIAVGDGPIDASFIAIDQIIGHHFELDDFQIQAITEGKEAFGSTLIRLRSKGRLYSGKGISTDIIGAGIMAYVNAINKIIFEEN